MDGTLGVLLFVVLGVLPLAALGYGLGRHRPIAAIEQGGAPYHSTPDYYGWYTVLAMFGPAIAVTAAALALWAAEIATVGTGWILAAWILLPLAALYPALITVRPSLRARNIVERVVYAVLLAASLVSIVTTIGILASVLVEAIRFFTHEDVEPLAFFTGTTWSPDSAFVSFRGEKDVADPKFGALPLFAGTLMITAIAMLVSVPLGVLSAIFLSEYAPRRVRKVGKPVIEILAGVPTVVYGFFAAITVSPFIVEVVQWVDAHPLAWINAAAGWEGEAALHLDASYENALSPGLIMGVMIIPFMSSLTDDVLRAVPGSLRQGAYALGATSAEVVQRVVVPASLPGIVSAFLLAVSRALGETMIVVMAAGRDPALTGNPLEAMTTVTVQIVAAMTGDQSYDSPETLSAFGLGLTLLVMTLVLNVIAAVVIRKFRHAYE